MHGPSPSGSPLPYPHCGSPHRGGTSITRYRTVRSLRFRGALLLALGLCGLNAAALELRASPERSTTGAFTLRWEGPEGADYRLIQLNDGGDRRLVYQGRDTARVMTGLGDGDYRYQVETANDWSEPVRVSVAHHSLIRAFSFFGVGLVVFLATVALVVRGEGRS